MNIGWAGNFSRREKNFTLALEVSRRMGFRLDLAGPKDTYQFVPHDRMPEWYNGLDALLVTSEFEAHLLVVYEALACGLPVIYPRDVGDVYANRASGVVYYGNHDVKSVEAAILTTMANKESLSDNAVNYIENNMTWDKIKDQYIRMFQAVGGKPEPLVVSVINEHNWAWDFIMKEIKEHVYPDIEIYYTDDHSPPREWRWDSYDVILNHMWASMNDITIKGFPMKRSIACINGPSYLYPQNRMIFSRINKIGRAFTSVSLPICTELAVLRHVSKPVFYATRGVDTEVFRPL